MAMHPSNPLVCLHVCLHSKRVSSELAFALDKQRLAYQLPKIAAALPDRLNPSVVHNLQIIEGHRDISDCTTLFIHSSDLINYLRMESLIIFTW